MRKIRWVRRRSPLRECGEPGMEKDPRLADPSGSGSALSVSGWEDEGKRNRRRGGYEGHGAVQKRVAHGRVAKVRIAEERVARGGQGGSTSTARHRFLGLENVPSAPVLVPSSCPSPYPRYVG